MHHHVDPCRDQVHFLAQSGSFFHAQLVLGLVADRDDVLGLDAVGRDIHHLAVNRDGLVRNHLAGLGTRHGKAHAEDDIVQPAFQQSQEGFARGALLLGTLLPTLQLVPQNYD